MLALAIGLAVSTFAAMAPAERTGAPLLGRTVVEGRSGAGASPAAHPSLTWLRQERVLFLGDSLLQSIAPELRRRLDGLDVTNRVLAYNGSGLGYHPYPWTWADLATREVARFRPTVVVVELCCNWRPPGPPDEHGNPIRPGTPQFRQAWEERARTLARIVTAGGAELWWVVTPPASNTWFDAAVIDPINDTTFAQARRPDPGVPAPRLVRWDLALTGGTGSYRDDLVVDGRLQRVRDGGVHFEEAGRRLALDSLLATLAGEPTSTPWGPFESLGTIPRYLAEHGLGLDPYGPEANLLATRYRDAVVAGRPWRDALADLIAGDPFGATAAPLARLALDLRGTLPSAGELRLLSADVRSGRTTLAEVADLMLSEPGVRSRLAADASGVDLVTRAYRVIEGRLPTPAEERAGLLELAGPAGPGGFLAGLSQRAPALGPRETRARRAVVAAALLDEVGVAGTSATEALAEGFGGTPPSWRSLVDEALAGPSGRDRITAYVPRGP